MSKYISLDYLESCIHSINDPSGKYYVLRIIDADDIHNANGDCVIEVDPKSDLYLNYDEVIKHLSSGCGYLIREMHPVKLNHEENIIMNYEEKREIRKQISQLLADAGLNQGKIKEMVEEEIRNKVNRAIEQTLKNLDAQSESGSYITDKAKSYFKDPNLNYHISEIIKSELKNRVIDITLKDVKINED